MISLPASRTGGIRVGDYLVDGVLQELKSIKPGVGGNAVLNAVEGMASRGGQARHLIVNAADSGLDWDNIVFQLGTAKYGARTHEGDLSEERLLTLAAVEQVKMFEGCG